MSHPKGQSGPSLNGMVTPAGQKRRAAAAGRGPKMPSLARSARFLCRDMHEDGRGGENAVGRNAEQGSVASQGLRPWFAEDRRTRGPPAGSHPIPKIRTGARGARAPRAA